ncbi:phage tail protein [Proteus mirabilis]|nr:phage tail protein [Proteus mirabilis]
MSAKYFTLLTVIGANKLANATALGKTLKITQMAVGDGNGVLPVPNINQTRLVNEKRRGALNTLFIDPLNTNQIIAEQVIPENEGGYWIREIGLFDESGSLVAVGNCPETYKPKLQEGSGRTQTMRMILTVSHAQSVDPSVVLVTRDFLTQAISQAVEEFKSQTFGFGQKWYNVSSERKVNVTYTNTTKRPILLSVMSTPAEGINPSISVYVDNQLIAKQAQPRAVAANTATLSVIVPHGAMYRYSVIDRDTGGDYSVWEYR